jgi:hypothetical protein
MTTISRFAVAVLLAATVSVASASELCAGVSDVTTIQAAGGCTVAGSSLIFNNFHVGANSGFTSATIGISGTAFGTGVFGSDVDLAFQIGGLSGPGLPDHGVIDLSYTVIGGIRGLDLVLQATQIDQGGSVMVTEEACSVAWIDGICHGILLADFSVTSTGQAVHKARLFDTSYGGEVFIEKAIDFDGGYTSSLVNSHLTGTPEPGSLILVGFGLLGFGLVRRRRG